MNIWFRLLYMALVAAVAVVVVRKLRQTEVKHAEFSFTMPSEEELAEHAAPWDHPAMHSQEVDDDPAAT